MQRGCRRHHTTANLKTAVWSPFGTRPECGTRGISHPRNGQVPAGAPQQYDPLLAVRADGGVV